MKLGRTSWLILAVGIFIVVVASLGLARSQQVQEQSQLDEELSVAEMRLNQLQVKQLSQQQEELQGKLDKNDIQLAAAKDKMRQTVESIDVTDKFFEIAQYCGVEVAALSSSSIRSENLGGINCSVIALNATVEGDVSNLINFITSLNSVFTTGIVKSAQISIPDAADGGEPSATMAMVVYTYEGD